MNATSLGSSLSHASRGVLRVAALWLGSLTLGCTGHMDGEPTLFEAEDEPSGTADAGASATNGAGSGNGSGATDAATPARLTGDLLSNEAITELLVGFKYRGEGFVKVNDMPFPSTVSPQKNITLYVSETGYDAFARISPDKAGSHSALPVGTVVIREVLSGAQLDAITVMMRLPQGAFPLGGDWWYAAAGADGVIKKDAKDGTPLIGLLENCGTCHLRRRDDDYLFGSPTAYITKH